MFKVIFKIYFLILVILITTYYSFNFAQNINDNISKQNIDSHSNQISSGSTIVETESVVDDLDESIDSNITTKIYKSTDSSAELLQNDSNIAPSIEADVINKKELIKNVLNHHPKVINREAINGIKNNKLIGNKPSLLLPVSLLVALIIILALIFKYLGRK